MAFKMSCLLFLLLFGYSPHSGLILAQPSDETAKNVIFIIGDGMGLAHLSYLAYSSEYPIAVESFPVVGFQKTHSISHLITDSGAAATAMACGVKTYNNAIGISSDSTPCVSLIELAKQHGKRTGLVVTSSLVHATPAAFVAHQSLRGFYEAIAENLVNLEMDYFVGGGQMYFTNRFSDDRNLFKELEAKGYIVSGYDRKSFTSFRGKQGSRMAYFTAHSEPLPRMQGREDLSEMVTHALHVLSAEPEKGFFLLIEGSQIDFASHGNDAGYLLSEMKDTDGGIQAAMDFATGRDDTLVIVTADHESGSLALRSTKPDRRAQIEFMSRNHTCAMVPVFAYGPGAKTFAGMYDNTEIFYKIKEVAGY